MIPVFRFRKFHRYLGVIVGIQILLWTVSGLYFSWSNLDEIHGDFTRSEAPPLPADETWVSPSEVLARLDRPEQISGIADVDVIDINGVRVYRIELLRDDTEEVILADAVSGALRGSLSEDEAVSLARRSFEPEVEIAGILRLEEGDVGPHHEYRERPLPAWQIRFEHPSKTRVYVSADYGDVQTHRNYKWRLFDFLWMLHTMDYRTRDDFNTLHLRALSLLGLTVVFSGFTLFFVTRKRSRRRVA